MFWGLIMEPQKRYSQTVKKAFHISMASLDLTSSTDDVVQVMCAYDSRKYLLCTLQRDKTVQCPLDLNFDVGTQVSFITNGSSHVHLTGYLVQDEEDLFGDVEESDDDLDVSLGNISASNIVSGKRAKNGKELGQLNGMPAKLNKKMEKLVKSGPPAKKLKTMDLLQDIQDDDDEEDSDVDLNALLAEEEEDEDDTILDEEDSSDDDEEDVGEDEIAMATDSESDDDEEVAEEDGDEDEDDDEDEEGDDDEVEEEEEDPVVATAKQNGTAKKAKKEIKPDQKSPKSEKKQQKKTIEGGVIIEDIRAGNGQLAKNGKMVQVYYEGRFKSNNKMFDSATKGNGFKFRLGRAEVIKGWDIGVAGMKVGGKRRITCPAAMAYGQKGSPPTIPPNSTLVFEVELKNVS